METKSDIVRRLVVAGDFKSAFRIAKGFRLGISKETSATLQRGYECMVHPQFYRGIGVNTEAAVQSGIEAIMKIYGPTASVSFEKGVNDNGNCGCSGRI